MVRESELREGELTVDMPPAKDAGLVFIGRIRTPWKIAAGNPAAGPSRRPGLPPGDFRALGAGDQRCRFLLDTSRCSTGCTSRAATSCCKARRTTATTRGAFSLRSPVRPNPIGTSIVRLVGVEGDVVLVRGLDCLDGTPLIDLKPDRCDFTPLASPQAGDFETE